MVKWEPCATVNEGGLSSHVQFRFFVIPDRIQGVDAVVVRSGRRPFHLPSVSRNQY